MSNQFISLEQAVIMTTLCRQQKENILKEDQQGKNIIPISETFSREVIDVLLAQEGCASLRVYYSMDEELRLHNIIVGVNKEGQDMLLTLGKSKTAAGSEVLAGPGDDPIVENGLRCPDDCPDPSPLNP